ncbi:MAG: rod shape-determining protein MreC [bacterium]
MKVVNNNKSFLGPILILICIILALVSFRRTSPTFLETSIGYVLTPIQSSITSVSTWVEQKFQTLSNINDAENQIEQLKLELELKNQEISRLQQYQLENEKLSELLDTSSKYSEYSTLTADIIAKDPSNWYEMFTINKGSNDGIEKNMVVISNGGLVGKVEEVGINYSKVSSIINGTYSVSSKTLRTDDEGFVKGDLSNKGTCRMDYIDKDAEIKEGDEVITSHLSDIYPAGITIGFVTSVSLDDEKKISKTATIEPIVDFKHLEKVLVITS